MKKDMEISNALREATSEIGLGDGVLAARVRGRLARRRVVRMRIAAACVVAIVAVGAGVVGWHGMTHDTRSDGEMTRIAEVAVTVEDASSGEDEKSVVVSGVEHVPTDVDAEIQVDVIARVDAHARVDAQVSEPTTADVETQVAPIAPVETAIPLQLLDQNLVRARFLEFANQYSVSSMLIRKNVSGTIEFAVHSSDPDMNASLSQAIRPTFEANLAGYDSATIDYRLGVFQSFSLISLRPIVDFASMR